MKSADRCRQSVIPAEAGIQMESSATSAHPLGSRFRGNERTGVTRSISAKLALIENPHALQIDDLQEIGKKYQQNQ